MDGMMHKHKGTGWVIGLIVLVAILIALSFIVPKTAAKPDMMNDQQTAQSADDLQSIDADINSSLDTDLQTDDLGI